MRKAGKWLIRITLTGILFLMFCGNAYALRERTLTACCPSRGTGEVKANWKNEEMTLYLPGCWDLTGITLEMEGTESLLLGEEGIPVLPGEPADLSRLMGRRIPVRNGEGQGRGNLTILQGSEISALFLEVDREQLSRVNHNKDYQITEGLAIFEEADGTVSYDGALDQLKGRGNNTFRYTKKPYQLKLREKASLSGMSRGKTWVLLANWMDISLLRNQIVLDLSREAGLKNAVSCVQTDVWINGDYQGLYLLTEKIQIGSERISITNLEKATEKVNPSPFDAGRLIRDKSQAYPLLRSYPAVTDPEDITGGYIFTVEKKARMRDYMLAGFRTQNELSIRIKEPTFPSTKQTEYLYHRISEMQKALIAKDGIEPETGRSYEEYLDTESFARKFLIEDWCKNYDFAGGSQFMYKNSDRTDPLIYAGPAWDYDLSFGNMKDRGYYAGGAYLTAYRKNQNLYWLLYNHEPFRTRVKEIWRDDIRPAVAVLLGEAEAGPDCIVRSMEEYMDRISASVQMNTRRWGISRDAARTGAGDSFENAVRYLREWIRERTVWMDREYRPETAENDQ